MPTFNSAAIAYVGTIELDDVEIDLDISTIVSECEWAELLAEMIDVNKESALTAISETMCTLNKYPWLLNGLARVDELTFNNCLSAAGWIKTTDVSALDNFSTNEIIDWLTECRRTQLAECMKARAPQRLTEMERTAIAIVANYMNHQKTEGKNKVAELEKLTVHTDLLHTMLIQSVNFEELK